MKRLLLVALFVLAIALYVADKLGAPEAEPRPHVTPSSQFVNVRSSMAFFRERLMKEPGHVQNYVALAQLHMQEARSTGLEAEHLPRARRLLEEALERDPDNFHALALRGSLLNSLHRFDDALAAAQRLLEMNERSAFAYGVMVDALVELGGYDEAVQACDRMLALRPDLASYARASYLRQLHGDTDGAIDAMRLAAEAGVAGSEERTWALYNLGSLFLESARLDTAAYVFEGILEERPGYAFAVAGLGRIDLVLGRHDEAVARFEQAYAEQPRAEFLFYLMDAYDELGDRAKADAARANVLASFEEARAAGENVDMEYADFLADQEMQLDAALRMAERDYRRRPEHVHAQETYAWALHKNGRSGEAVPYIERALRRGATDAMLHYRAAAVFEAVGLSDKAASHLRRALAHHLHVESPAAAREARARLSGSI